MSGLLQHRLLDLIHTKEKKLGRRLSIAEIAKGAGVSEKLVYRWLDAEKHISRFDENAIVGFCEYFDCRVGELLEYEAAEADE